MGGLEWAAVPVMAEMLGVVDVETFIAELAVIRTWNEEQKKE